MIDRLNAVWMHRQNVCKKVYTTTNYYVFLVIDFNVSSMKWAIKTECETTDPCFMSHDSDWRTDWRDRKDTRHAIISRLGDREMKLYSLSQKSGASIEYALLFHFDKCLKSRKKLSRLEITMRVIRYRLHVILILSSFLCIPRTLLLFLECCLAIAVVVLVELHQMMFTKVIHWLTFTLLWVSFVFLEICKLDNYLVTALSWIMNW